MVAGDGYPGHVAGGHDIFESCWASGSATGAGAGTVSNYDRNRPGTDIGGELASMVFGITGRFAGWRPLRRCRTVAVRGIRHIGEELRRFLSAAVIGHVSSYRDLRQPALRLGGVPG